jgi:HNH endonuclease/AP2 domain
VKKKPIPPEIADYISYNPETGDCHWKKLYGRRAKLGDLIKTSALGYLKVGFMGDRYQLHRVVWFLHYGEDPGDMVVDHINRDRSDNRIENLRLLTQQQNTFNHGSLGITYDKSRQKWVAFIMRDRKTIYLGRYPCPLLAGIAYQEAKAVYHKL